MQNQYFPQLFAEDGTPLGNSHYGPDVARTAAAGSMQRRVLDPYSSLGIVGNPVEMFESPIGGMQGQVAVPNRIAPAEIIPITIDTTNEPEPVKVILFDPKDLYSNSNCDGCAKSGSGGIIFSGDRDCNKYDSIVSMLCSTKYILSSLRVSVRGAGANPGTPTLDMPIKIWRGNIYNRQFQDAINPIDHISSFQNDNGIADIPLTDDKALLDMHTAWIMTVDPGLLVTLRGYVALRR